MNVLFLVFVYLKYAADAFDVSIVNTVSTLKFISCESSTFRVIKRTFNFIIIHVIEFELNFLSLL